MKKLVNGILALTLCLSVVGQMTAAVPLQIIAADEAAENTVTVDGLTYQLYFSDIEGISDYAELVGVEDQDITSVTIPAEVNGCKVTYVKSGIFSECKDLEQINTENTEKDAAYSIDGVLFTHESLLNAYPPDREGAYVIPDGTKTIGMEAFKNASKLTSVTLPDSLVKIDMLAFSECTALEEVIGAVPGGDGSAFYHCSSLKSLTFAEPNPNYPDSSSLCNFDLIACSSLETLVIPENLMVCDINLSGCTSLKSLTIPNASDECSIILAYCDSLQSLTLPDIGSITVSECAKLNNIDINSARFVTVENCPELKHINTDGYISKLGITSCQNLERLSIKGSRHISISNCPELTALNILVESRFTKLQNVDKLTVYGTEIFKYTQQDCEEAGVPFALLEQNSGDTNDDTIAMRFVLRDDVDVSAAAEQMAEVLDEYFPGLKDGLDTQSGIISYKIPRDPSDDSNIPYRVMLFQSAYWGGEGNSRIIDLTMPMCYFPEDAETIEAEVLLAFARRQLISEFYGWGETADYETRYFSDDVLAHHDMTQYVRNQNPTGHNALEQPGDVTLDCEIDILDVIAANKAILGASTLCNTAQKNCDINGDGTPDTTDALAILKEVVGLTTNFAEP